METMTPRLRKDCRPAQRETVTRGVMLILLTQMDDAEPIAFGCQVVFGVGGRGGGASSDVAMRAGSPM